MRLLFLLVAASMVASTGAAERALVIDPAQSRVEVAVKATVDSFVGRLTAYQPDIIIDDGGGVTRARFAFHFRDLATGKSDRDRAMHKWQQTEAHPDGLFVLTSLEPGETAMAKAYGRLTLHGVTRDVAFPVAITRDGSWYAIDGEAPIDTRDYGLPGIRLLALLKVNPVVHVRFHLQGIPAGPVETRP